MFVINTIFRKLKYFLYASIFPYSVCLSLQTTMDITPVLTPNTQKNLHYFHLNVNMENFILQHNKLRQRFQIVEYHLACSHSKQIHIQYTCCHFYNFPHVWCNIHFWIHIKAFVVGVPNHNCLADTSLTINKIIPLA